MLNSIKFSLDVSFGNKPIKLEQHVDGSRRLKMEAAKSLAVILLFIFATCSIQSEAQKKKEVIKQTLKCIG